MKHFSNLFSNSFYFSILLFLFSFGVFSFSLSNDFVWDDIEEIKRASYSYKFSNTLHSIIPESHKKKENRYYRPAVYLSMVIDYSIWGLNSEGYHLSNIVYNSLAVVAFYILVVMILTGLGVRGGIYAAGISGVLYALHPMHVESVSWIAGRTDILSGLFLYIAFIFHIKSRERIWYVLGTVVMFYMSMLSKEVGVVFVLMVVGYDVLRGGKWGRGEVGRYVLYGVVLGLYLYIRGRGYENVPALGGVVSGEGGGEGALGYIGVLGVMMRSYMYYAWKMVWPYEFNAFISEVPGGGWLEVMGLVVVVGAGVLGYWLWRRGERVVLYGMCWMVLALGPGVLVSVMSISSTALAERYMYIGLGGYALVWGHVFWRGIEPESIRVWVLMVMVVMMGSYLAFDVQRQLVWRNDLTFWKAASEINSTDALPHSNLGVALSNSGYKKEAIKEYKLALSPTLKDTDRGRSGTAINLGIIYMDEGSYEQAEKWFLLAYEYDKNYGKALYHLGLINYIKAEVTGNQNSYQIAEYYLIETLKRYRSYAKANLLLAETYLILGDTDSAKNQAKIAIKRGLSGTLKQQALKILRVDDNPGN